MSAYDPKASRPQPAATGERAPVDDLLGAPPEEPTPQEPTNQEPGAPEPAVADPAPQPAQPASVTDDPDRGTPTPQPPVRAPLPARAPTADGPDPRLAAGVAGLIVLLLSIIIWRRRR